MYSCPLLTVRSSLYPDELEFIELCERGALYQHLRSLCSVDPLIPHDEFKRRVFASVFYGRILPNPEPLLLEFAAHFPNVQRLIDAMKRPAYQELARAMQRLESWLFIGGVCERIRQEKPDMFMASIHDSLLVLPEDANYAESVIQSTYRSVGLRPKIKREFYLVNSELAA
jgi:hypothetical protein